MNDSQESFQLEDQFCFNPLILSDKIHKVRDTIK